nr:hypothetical protein [Tanacetum cinerariifolium]
MANTRRLDGEVHEKILKESCLEAWSVSFDHSDCEDMAPLPPREQRCPFLRYQGLEYSDQDIADFEERMRMEHCDGDEVVVFTSHERSRVFESRGPLVRELILEFLSTLRFEEVLLDLDAPGTIQRFAAGRKSRALISGGQFVAQLAEHFGLLTEERLQGLTVTALTLPIIDMAELVRPQIDVNPFSEGNPGFHDDHYDNPLLTKETESVAITWDIGDEKKEYPFVNKYPSFQEEPIVLVEEESCHVYDTDNEEESMPVYDTNIEDAIEEEEGFVRKGGFGEEEENIEYVVVVANDLYSLMIQTILSVDFEEDINTKSNELMSFEKSIIIKKSRIASKRGAHERSTDLIKGNTPSSINGDENRIRGKGMSRFIANHLLELKSSPPVQSLPQQVSSETMNLRLA